MNTECTRGPENITQKPFQRTRRLPRPRFIRYVNRCKIMPPYCRHSPMRMLLCTRVCIRCSMPTVNASRSTKRRQPDGQVKTHSSLSSRQLFRGCCSAGKKKPISSDINVVCTVLKHFLGIGRYMVHELAQILNVYCFKRTHRGF